MEFIFLILGVIYFSIITYFYIGLLKLSTSHFDYQFTVSVMIPARNEADNILTCLRSLWNQTYSKELYEVVIIDDHSTDNTSEVVKNFIADKPNFRLVVHKPNGTQPTYKKQALNYGLQFAKGEIIMTVDADTETKPNWIETMMKHYDRDTGLVAGLITFSKQSEKTLLHKIQTLEFAGIVFCGVGSLGNGQPLICNGSNLSYRRQSFEEVGGYDGNLHLPSGDDDLLLQNIHHKTNWKVKYCLDWNTINYTKPEDTFRRFLNQRARWASKSLHYPKAWLFPILLSIYIFYVSIILLLILTIFDFFPIHYYLIGLGLKLFPEFMIIFKATTILKRKDLLPLFLFAQIFQVTYIMYSGVMGFFHKFRWKD